MIGISGGYNPKYDPKLLNKAKQNTNKNEAPPPPSSQETNQKRDAVETKSSINYENTRLAEDTQVALIKAGLKLNKPDTKPTGVFADSFEDADVSWSDSSRLEEITVDDEEIYTSISVDESDYATLEEVEISDDESELPDGDDNDTIDDSSEDGLKAIKNPHNPFESDDDDGSKLIDKDIETSSETFDA